MNWKEFLKPDWKKIVGVVILSALIPIPVSSCFCAGWDCICVIGQSLINILITSPHQLLYGYYFPFIIILILFYYLLSCLIVWIYDKVRKK